jgi:hypothetical protein
MAWLDCSRQKAKAPDAEGDQRIGGDVVLGEKAKLVGLGEILGRFFGQDGLAVRSGTWPLYGLSGLNCPFKRLDVGNLLDRYMFALDDDDVRHGNLLGERWVIGIHE